MYAWLVPPWAVVLHRGRRSGRDYRTPVLAFRRGRTLIIALLYGEESDWLRNLRAGPGRVVRLGRTTELVGEPRVVDTDAAPELAALSGTRAGVLPAGRQAGPARARRQTAGIRATPVQAGRDGQVVSFPSPPSTTAR